MPFFEIDQRSRVPIYEQLKQQVLRLAALGVLEKDSQIPSVRQTASDLGVNPNTVSKAYRELERDELIYTVPGKGSFLRDPRLHEDRLRQDLKERIRHLLETAAESAVSLEDLKELLEEVLNEESGHLRTALTREKRGE